MMTRFALVLLSAVAAVEPSAAQQRDPRRDAVYRGMVNFPSLVRGGTLDANWLADGNGFWYADSAPDRTVIFAVDPARNAVSRLFDQERVRKALAQALGYEPPYRGLPFSSLMFLDGERAVRFTAQGPARNATTATAPAGSATNFARNNRPLIASSISRSVTRTTPSR